MADEISSQDELRKRLERDAAAMSTSRAPSVKEEPKDDELTKRLSRDIAAMSPKSEPTDFSRQAAVAGRAIVSGAPAAVMGLPALTADAYESLVNMARRTYNLGAPAFGAEQVPYTQPFRNITALGEAGKRLAENLPMEGPKTPGERILTTGVETGLGALTGSGLASLARRFAPSVAGAPAMLAPSPAIPQMQQRAVEAGRQYATSASAAPALTTAGGLTGGAAAQYSAERGGTPFQNITAGLASGFLPTLAAAGGSRVITPFTSNLNPEQARLLNVAKSEYGLQPSAGQSLNIPILKSMESVASEMPGSIQMRASPQEQAKSFQSAVMRKANIPGELATPEATTAARDVAGSRIREIAENTAVIPTNTPEFGKSLTAVVQDYFKKPETTQRQAFTNWVQEIAGYGGSMSGTQYQEIRRQINDQASRYSKSTVAADRDYGEALRGLRKSLDDAFESATSKTKREDLDQARRDYALAKTIETAAGGAGGTSGVISGPRLRQVVEGQAPTLYRQGYGDLNDLSRIGKEFYTPAPQSGTEPRTLARKTLSYPISFPANAAFSAALLNPATQAYLRNQALASSRPPIFTSTSGATQGSLAALRGAAQEGLLGERKRRE